MRRKILLAVIVFPVFISLVGCAAAFIVGGAAGALGGYAISKDTIQGDSDKSYESLWNAAVAAAGDRGTIREANERTGRIELQAGSSQVHIRLIRLTRIATRVRVSARNKFHLPNLNLAEAIFVKIMETAG